MQRNFVSEEGVFINNVQLHQMCSIRPRIENAKIAFNDNIHILLDRKTKKMVSTEEWGISNTLASIGTRSQISLEWEIYGSFFSQNKGSLQKTKFLTVNLFQLETFVSQKGTSFFKDFSKITPKWVDCYGIGSCPVTMVKNILCIDTKKLKMNNLQSKPLKI